MTVSVDIGNQAVNLMLTTHCNLRCPDCCVGVPRRAPDHSDIDQLKEIAKHVNDFTVLNLTGGEPTLHPQLREVVHTIREVFRFQKLRICTNGKRLLAHMDILHLFDNIGLSRYPGINEDLVDEIHRAFQARGWPRATVEQPYVQGTTTWGGVDREDNPFKVNNPFKTKACSKYLNTICIEEGRVFPCCIGGGIEGAQSVPVSETWRQDILKAVPPCKNCMFAR